MESAAQQAELLEHATNQYSLIVQRVERAHFAVNKMVPPTPDTVPLSIPATFLQDVGEALGRDSKTGIQIRQYSDYPFPWRVDGGPRDDFERKALARLRRSSAIRADASARNAGLRPPRRRRRTMQCDNRGWRDFNGIKTTPLASTGSGHIR